MADGSALDRADRRTLALAYAFDTLLPETREALGDMVSPQALMAMVVWSAGLYFMLWLLPEPVSKGVRAGADAGVHRLAGRGHGVEPDERVGAAGA
jgi:hypothetical protein